MAEEQAKQRRLMRYLKGEASSYGFGVLMLLLTNLCTAGIPYLTKLAFDLLEGATSGPEGVGRGGPGGAVGRSAGATEVLDAGTGPLHLPGFVVGIDEPVGQVLALAGCIVALAIALGGFRVASRVLIFNGGRRVEYRLRNDVFAHLQTLSPAFFGRLPVGELISRTTADITAVRLLGGPGVLNIANTAVAYVAALVPMLILSARLTVWALAPLAVVFLSTRWIGPRIYRRSLAAQQALGAVTTTANESITGIGVVQSYVREEHRASAFARMSAEYRDASLGFVVFRAVLLPILGGLGGLGTLVVLWLGGSMVVAGQLTMGDFVAFLGYLAMLTWPTVALGWMVSMWQRGRSAMDRLGEILDTAPEVVGRGDERSVDLEGTVECRGLSFAYTDAAGKAIRVLHDIELRIEAGEHVLLVGPSGAGKTALVSLLPHLSAVSRGQLFIGGMDINDLPLAGLRRRVAFVPQEAFLFSMSLRENIGFGMDDPHPDAVRAAVELASLAGDLSRFPEGLDTPVGERGVTLSGGQRQRMTIARAAMLEPAIWVFDDCLSSVDGATEQRIIRNLRQMTSDATALFVTHRLLGFEGVDRIVVLDQGRVVEQGDHTELMAQDGWYARLYRRQKVDDELGGERRTA